MKKIRKVPTIKEWHTPATDYPRCLVGMAEIADYVYTPGAYESYYTNGHKYYRVTRAIKITNLIIRGETWMIDDPPHWWGMQKHAAVMHGHVLCGGLGLGLMAHALAANPKVTKITIVEKEADVIRLMRPNLPPGCEIVHGDFWRQDIDADSVLLDILVGSGEDLCVTALGQYIQLRRAYPEAPIRIHGFSNDHLDRTAREIIDAEKNWYKHVGQLVT